MKKAFKAVNKAINHTHKDIQKTEKTQQILNNISDISYGVGVLGIASTIAVGAVSQLNKPLDLAVAGGTAVAGIVAHILSKKQAEKKVDQRESLLAQHSGLCYARDKISDCPDFLDETEFSM